MELESRLKKLETRLSYIEKFLAENLAPRGKAVATEPASPPAPATATPAASLAPPASKSFDHSFMVPNYTPADPGVKASLHFIDSKAFNKNAAGRNSNYLLGPVAVLGFLLASFFVLKLGIDTGWLTAAKQMFLAVVASVLFIAAGFFYKEMHNEYIRYLPGVGIVLLFLAGYGSSNYYHFFPRNAAFLFVGTIAVSSMLMYREFQHAVYMIVAAAGAYIIPLYVANDSNLTLTNSYFILMSLIFSGIACWLNLRPVYLLCAYLSIPISTIADYHDNDMLHKSLFILAHFLIFSGGMFIHVLRTKQNIIKSELMASLPLVLLFFVIQFYTLSHFGAGAAVTMLVAICCYLGGLYVVVRKALQVAPEPAEISVVDV